MSNLNNIFRELGITSNDPFGTKEKIRKNEKKFIRITDPKSYITEKNKYFKGLIADIDDNIQDIYTANKDIMSTKELKDLINETINHKVNMAKKRADLVYPKVEQAYNILSYKEKLKKKAGLL